MSATNVWSYLNHFCFGQYKLQRVIFGILPPRCEIYLVAAFVLYGCELMIFHCLIYDDNYFLSSRLGGAG